MTTEETNVDLKEVETKDAQLKEKEEAEDCAPVAADADATEADVSEADLDQEEQEKLPMTGGEGEGDQAVEAPSAGGAEPGPAGWLALRAGCGPAGRCWWSSGWAGWACWVELCSSCCRRRAAETCPPSTGGTRVAVPGGNIQAFSDTRDLKGVEQKISSLSQLKVRGLVLGPVHVAPADDAMSLRFEEVSSEAGSLEQFKSLVQAAHKKGISVVLDLTPNYQGTSGPWFSNTSVTSVAERLKSALVFWMKEGVDGVQLSGVERVAAVVPTLWADIRAIVQNGTDEGPDKRVLIGITERSSAEEVSSLLSSSGVDLLLSGVLRPPVADPSQSLQLLYSSHSQSQLAWSLGGPAGGHLASVGGAALLRLHQLLLLTLPGTPVFNYGDEIGLMDGDTKFPRMLWDSEEELNGTLQEERVERLSLRRFFRTLSELRVKERSLMFGDFLLLSNSSSSSSSSSSSLAFLRVWDQSERYVAAFNFAAAESAVLQLVDAALPPQAVVVLSTNSSALPGDSSVDLKELRLGPLQAALLRFPYTG
ncbi:4F2 cell-surface antigen heavy chain [Dissostichus eleginoides]|uniref:4F2 cell-surface antigen heavy chain n=1 Tax=Dissostichus eleginoides TaxID=100907 RepID=A0AAD9B4L0_DISEL|nr:4F2 cell-surface antigen heavy chain [Dissostichus eleginoides]